MLFPNKNRKIKITIFTILISFLIVVHIIIISSILRTRPQNNHFQAYIQILENSFKTQTQSNHSSTLTQNDNLKTKSNRIASQNQMEVLLMKLNLTLNEMKTFKNRKAQLEEYCSKKFSVQNIKLFKKLWIHYNFLHFRGFDVELKWCPVYKSASTPWMAIFSKLKSILTPFVESQIHNGSLTFIDLTKRFRFAYPNYQFEYSYTGKSNSKNNLIIDRNPIKLSMIQVRHPFERILSAYRDKLERVEGRNFYFLNYGRDIKNLYPDPDRNFTLKTPTFKQFVQYLISTNPYFFDQHWRPVYIECNLCSNKYDLILKIDDDHFNMDKNIIFNKILKDSYNNSTLIHDELNKVWKKWANTYTGKSTDNKTTMSISYFSKISKKMLIKLENVYEKDLILFGYNATNYVNMGYD